MNAPYANIQKRLKAFDFKGLFTQELMQEMLMKWDRAALVVFVDYQGKRGIDAAAYFAGHGFTNVKTLRGGIDAWSREIDPSVPRYELE